MTPFFSVVIPLFNKAHYIEATIKSVLAQTFRDFEIIVVNDGSTDGSLDIIKRFGNDKIRLFSQENKGLSATRNFGISVSKGNIIALLDADDIWLPNHLQHIKQLYETFPDAKIYGTDYCEKYNKNSILSVKKNLPEALKNQIFIVEDVFLSNINQTIFCQSSLAFNKNIVTNYSVFDKTVTYAEDIDFYIRFCYRYKTAYFYKVSVEINANVANQITKSSLLGKTLPNLDKYETWTENHKSLKLYLDFYRYVFSHLYRLENQPEKAKRFLSKIDYKNLTVKQIILLKSPIWAIKLINRIKFFLLKFNFRITSY
ncbi:MAG: glycosyltransferase family 2 protein [Flavobacteriaceae bacterium]